MTAPGAGTGGLPAPFTTPGSSSFADFVAAQAPQLLPGARDLMGADHAAHHGAGPAAGVAPALVGVPHATTIVALTYADGVLMAGDRRATAGNLIAHREMEKVFPADGYSCVGIAGSAGLAVELVRLFQVELEHYEKIEGALLSLDGKANRLATMVRSNLPLAMQGLAVVPLFAGYDLDRAQGRIFSYDVTGGRYEEHDHHSVGSGSLFARGSLKKLWRPGMSAAEAVRVAVESLVDASDDDSATGGPDRLRQVWPVVATVTAQGYRRVDQAEMTEVVEASLTERGEVLAGRRSAGAIGSAGAAGGTGEVRP